MNKENIENENGILMKMRNTDMMYIYLYVAYKKLSFGFGITATGQTHSRDVLGDILKTLLPDTHKIIKST